MSIRKAVKVQVDLNRRFQQIDGLGININSKCWEEGLIEPVMELLLDDLGATLFRLDAYGKSNWIDPDNLYDKTIMGPETYKKTYQGWEFERAAKMAGYLNARGIEPYVTISGIAPAWMCAADGRTLTDYESFAEMVASYVYWAKREAGIKFTMFGPLNETDIGPPEGPAVSPVEYVKAFEAMVDAFDRWGLDDIRFVVAEQASYNLDYIKLLLNNEKLAGRIGVFGMHAYFDFHVTDLVETVENSPFNGIKCWMTEYGDLDETGEKEWYVGWVTFERMMRFLEDGMTGGLIWDAFDNYHDHDEAWSLFGLLRRGRLIYTPKKRYYAAKHAFRFIRPGYWRTEASAAHSDIAVQSFFDPDSGNWTLIGMNKGTEDVYLQVRTDNLGLQKNSVSVFMTTGEDNFMRTDRSHVYNPNRYPHGIETKVKARSIFTITTLED